jgi:hypothetical protein
MRRRGLCEGRWSGCCRNWARGVGQVWGGRDGGWERERLFAGVAELLNAVAAGSAAGVGLVVEDVHWADTATLDLLTFLARHGRRGAVRVVVTCRSDEAPLAGPVTSWLALVRGEAGMAEIALGPLSRAEAAEQVTALANTFLRSAEGRVEASFPVLNRALAMAEAVGATALIPQILSVLAGEAFVRGQVEQGFTILQRAWNLARAAEDGPATPSTKSSGCFPCSRPRT